MVSFANEQLRAASRRTTRLWRPVHSAAAVLMTASAMIIGMVPMSLGLGEGGEQNAPLGRAVIGGLIFATASTLIFVPVIFTLIRERIKHAPEPAATPLSHGGAAAG